MYLKKHLPCYPTLTDHKPQQYSKLPFSLLYHSLFFLLTSQISKHDFLQMKTALLLASCLVLFSLLVEIQGIRLEPGFEKPLQQSGHVSKEKKERLIEVEASGGVGNIGVEEHVLCKDAGRSTRKLITKAPSTTTTSKNVKNEGTKVDPKMNQQPTDHAHGHGGNEENFSVKSSSSPKPEHGQATTGQYPDIIDIAGMDYSPARRKPPIHN